MENGERAIQNCSSLRVLLRRSLFCFVASGYDWLEGSCLSDLKVIGADPEGELENKEAHNY